MWAARREIPSKWARGIPTLSSQHVVHSRICVHMLPNGAIVGMSSTAIPVTPRVPDTLIQRWAGPFFPCAQALITESSCCEHEVL